MGVCVALLVPVWVWCAVLPVTKRHDELRGLGGCPVSRGARAAALAGAARWPGGSPPLLLPLFDLAGLVCYVESLFLVQAFVSFCRLDCGVSYMCL